MAAGGGPTRELVVRVDPFIVPEPAEHFRLDDGAGLSLLG